MTDATDERIDSIERGLDALFATEVASEVLEAVDFEAIMAEEPAQDPVDVERLAEALGRPVGRALAQYVVGGSGASGVAKRAIGSELGQRAAATGVRVAVDHVDPDAVAETLVELDEETLPGPALNDAIPVDVEASDVFDFDPDAGTDESVDIDVGDAGDGTDGSGEFGSGAFDSGSESDPGTDAGPDSDADE